MKCDVCGAQNDPGTAYCYQCGSRLRQPSAPATGQTVLMTSDTAAEPQPDRPPATEATPETRFDTPYVAPPLNAPRPIDQRSYDASNHPLMQPEPQYQQPAPQYQQPQYQQPAPQYQQPQYQQPLVQTPYLVTSVSLSATQTSTMAVLSLVLGILSWMVLPMVGAIGGIVTGHMARREIMGSDGRYTGGGMALAGLILSYLNLLLSLGACALFAILVASS